MNRKRKNQGTRMTRNRQARQKQRRSHRQKARTILPRTAKQFFAMSPRYQDRWNSITHVVSRMRADRVSLARASKESGLSPRTVTKWAKSALRKGQNGRYQAKPKDTLLRVLTFPTPDGLREIAVRDSRQASRLGKYSAAVQKYLQTGDASGIDKFRGKRVTDASGKRIPLISDLKDLDRLGSAGVLSFESLYARAA